MSRKAFQTTYIIVTLITFLMTIFPLFAIGNRSYPIVIGLPFSFFWVVMWVVIAFVALVVLYFLDPDERE